MSYGNYNEKTDNMYHNTRVQQQHLNPTIILSCPSARTSFRCDYTSRSHSPLAFPPLRPYLKHNPTSITLCYHNITYAKSVNYHVHRLHLILI